MTLYKIVVYVPSDHTEPVKQALFDAGAGKIGDYDHCCWSVEGVGQFRPGDKADPFLGRKGRVEAVAETRLELVCSADCIKSAIGALMAVHPYEEPAYQVFQCVDVGQL
ncbi:YqfO family protein [Halioxenophilus aromaticivorans]|uniref:NGG1p interacting factor NIF3 n=1 Tax=Halioxenophilus aromaticivorans TaxID=1306992 RepID=A0AAV3TYZ0_9ALTE